jgi:hypothetical protein
LRDVARADQRERRRQDYDGMEDRDAARLATVHAAVDAGRLCRPGDAWNAGVVLQHSGATADHTLAWELFSWACAEGIGRACDWAPLAWDRSLVSAGRPQWYGSQFQGKLDPVTGDHLATCLVAVDPAATDADRAAAGAPVLAEVVRRTYAQNGRDAPASPTVDQLVADGLVCEPKAW